MDFYKDYFLKIFECTNCSKDSIVFFDEALEVIDATRRNNRKILLAGNGGSAAIASHVTVDMVKVANIRAINFNEPDLITCFANDYGYEHWVERAIEFYGNESDIVILISSSGQSRNIINAAIKAKQMGLYVLTFSGFSPENPLRKLGDLNFWANSCEFNVVEMTHQIWLLALVDSYAYSNQSKTLKS